MDVNIHQQKACECQLMLPSDACPYFEYTRPPLSWSPKARSRVNFPIKQHFYCVALTKWLKFFNFKFIVIEQKATQLRVNDHVETDHKAAYEAKRWESKRILGKMWWLRLAWIQKITGLFRFKSHSFPWKKNFQIKKFWFRQKMDLKSA